MVNQSKINDSRFWEKWRDSGAVYDPVKLRIVDPHRDHSFEIAYESDSRLKCRAYNLALQEVCDKNKLGPYFQVGSDKDTGYKAWEMLGRDTSGQELKELIPEIHKRAKEKYFKLKEWGF